MLTAYRFSAGDGFQALTARDTEGFVDTYPDNAMGASMQQGWQELDCYVMNPEDARGDFFAFSIGVFGVTQRIADELGDVIASAGELLPIRVKRERMFLWNITRTLTILDPSKTEWRLQDGRPMSVKTFAFDPNRLVTESVFRMSEQFGLIVAVGGQPNPALDFHARYRALKLEGLTFTPIWSES